MDFESYYWNKKELIQLCRVLQIPSQGSKTDITSRISHFIKTSGEVKEPVYAKRQGPPDSHQTITTTTAVINYRNDAATRTFFVSQTSDKFKFNHALRQFAKIQNDGSLTYGDLVKIWLESIQTPKSTIDKQFEFNQFQRDFHKHEHGKSMQECQAAWAFIKTVPGKPTYQHYIKLINTKPMPSM